MTNRPCYTDLSSKGDGHGSQCRSRVGGNPVRLENVMMDSCFCMNDNCQTELPIFDVKRPDTTLLIVIYE